MSLPGDRIPSWVRDAAGLPVGLLNADVWWAVPLGLLQAITGAVLQRLVGRPIEVRVGGHAVRITLRELVVTPNRIGLIAGQLGEVHVVVDDIWWRGKRIDQLSLRLRHVALRPGLRPTIVASPVEITAVVASADLDGWLAEHVAGTQVAIGADATIRVTRRRLAGLGHLELTHRLEPDDLRLVPTSLVLRGHRLRAARIAQRRVALPTLPPGLVLVDATTGPEQLTVRLVAENWRHPLSPAMLVELLQRVRKADAVLEVPTVPGE